MFKTTADVLAEKQRIEAEMQKIESQYAALRKQSVGNQARLTRRLYSQQLQRVEESLKLLEEGKDVLFQILRKFHLNLFLVYSIDPSNAHS